MRNNPTLKKQWAKILASGQKMRPGDSDKRIIKEDKFMSTGWNSQQGEGKFAIQFETTHKDLYKMVEKACQNAMDEADARKSAKSGCFENGNNHISSREILGECCSSN